jgi:hypothetical protein
VIDMAATIQIHEMSALEAGTDKTSGTIRFKDADNATVDANNPLVIPSVSGEITYSYTKKVRLYMEAPPNTQVNNLRWYTDGGNGFGTGVNVGAKNLGVSWEAQHKTPISGENDLFIRTSAAPLDGDAVDAGPFVPADDDSYIGDLIEMQMKVAFTATQGTLVAETLTAAYDEI